MTELSDDARELDLYIMNDAGFVARVEAIARNYEGKRAKGAYDSKRAAKGFESLCLDAAHAYSRDFSTGRDGARMFPRSVRLEVCNSLREHLESEWAAGNFWTPAQ